jgi:hypothetical protein
VVVPGGGGFFEGALGGGQLFEHPVGLVVELGFALVEELVGVAEGDLSLAEPRAELDGDGVLGGGGLEKAGAGAVAVAIAAAASVAVETVAGAGTAVASAIAAAVRPGGAIGGRGTVGAPGWGFRAGLAAGVAAGGAGVGSR